MKRLVKAQDGFSFYDDYTYSWYRWDEGDYSKWKLISGDRMLIMHSFEGSIWRELPDDTYSKESDGYKKEMAFIRLAQEVDEMIKLDAHIEEFLSGLG